MPERDKVNVYYWIEFSCSCIFLLENWNEMEICFHIWELQKIYFTFHVIACY